MRALTWPGREQGSVDTVLNPRIQRPTEAVRWITSSGLCRSEPGGRCGDSVIDAQTIVCAP